MSVPEPQPAKSSRREPPLDPFAVNEPPRGELYDTLQKLRHLLPKNSRITIDLPSLDFWDELPPRPVPPKD